MKSRHANEYDDENYYFDDDSSNRFDDFSDDQDAADSKDMNFYVEEGDDAGSDAALDALPIDLYNLEDYGEELSPEDDDCDDDFDEDFIHLSDDDIYDEKFPEERDPHGDETVDLEKAAEVEIDEFDNLNTDENIYGGEDEL